jgi:hypothetical protein
MERNGFIFQGQQPDLGLVITRFRHEFALVILRAKISIKPSMTS